MTDSSDSYLLLALLIAVTFGFSLMQLLSLRLDRALRRAHQEYRMEADKCMSSQLTCIRVQSEAIESQKEAIDALTECVAAKDNLIAALRARIKLYGGIAI